MELANVAHGFSAPNAKLEGVIDLTNYDGPNDSVYDRWLELHSKVKINNLTLRQALTKLINLNSTKHLILNLLAVFLVLVLIIYAE